MKKNDGFTLIELLVTLVIVGMIMTFIISMMSSQYAIIRDVDAYLVMSSENKDVNDRIIQEFVKAEEIYINTGVGGNDFKSIVLNSSTSAFFTTAGIDLEKIRLKYPDPDHEGSYITVIFDRNDTDLNELTMMKFADAFSINDIASAANPNLIGDVITLGTHLAPAIQPNVTFYRRLSLDRRVVALVKVKINYLHDGITKQYDLFYHLRNLNYSN